VTTFQTFTVTNLRFLDHNQVLEDLLLYFTAGSKKKFHGDMSWRLITQTSILKSISITQDSSKIYSNSPDSESN